MPLVRGLPLKPRFIYGYNLKYQFIFVLLVDFLSSLSCFQLNFSVTHSEAAPPVPAMTFHVD